MSRPDRFTVLKCTARRDGSFLVILQKGGSAVSDVEIAEGKTVRVVDGRVVEVAA